MKVTKANLDFLDIFAHLIDSSTERGECFYLNVKDGVAQFCQPGEDHIVMTKLPLVEGKESKFSVVYPTDKFRKLVSEAKPADKLEITNQGISFGTKENYGLESLKLVMQGVDFYEKSLQGTKETVTLTDLALLSKAKTYASGDEGFNVVAYQAGYFVSTDEHTTCIVETKNKSEREFFIDKKILALFEKSKLTSVDIDFFDEKGLYTFVIKGVRVIVGYRQDVMIPYLVDEESRAIYNFEHTAKVPRELFLEKLKRVAVTADSNTDKRIVLLFSKEGVSIENREHNKTAVLVPGVCVKELHGREVVVSAHSLTGMVQRLEGQELVFKTTPVGIAAAVLTVTDEQKKIHLLHTEYRII